MYTLPEQSALPDYFQLPANMLPEQQRAYIANSLVNTPQTIGLDPGVSNYWKQMVAQQMLQDNALRNPTEVLTPVEQAYAERLGAVGMNDNRANDFFQWLGGQVGPQIGPGQQPTMAPPPMANGTQMMERNEMNYPMEGLDEIGRTPYYASIADALAGNPSDRPATSSGTGLAFNMPSFDLATNMQLNPEGPKEAENGIFGNAYNSLAALAGVVAPPIGALMGIGAGGNAVVNAFRNPTQADGVGFTRNVNSPWGSMLGENVSTPTYDMSKNSAVGAYNKAFNLMERQADLTSPVGAPTGAAAAFGGSSGGNDRTGTGTSMMSGANSFNATGTNSATKASPGAVNAQKQFQDMMSGNNQTTSKSNSSNNSSSWSDNFWSGGFNRNDGYGSASGGNFSAGGSVW